MTEPQPANELDTLREILFGDHARDTISRFTAVEKDFTKLLENRTHVLNDLITQLTESVDKRLAALEKEFDSRLERLRRETKKRDEDIQAELQHIAESLKDQKVSRQQMTQLLIELGNRLQEDD
jgi:hypothetical protein